MSHSPSTDNISVKYELWQNKMEEAVGREKILEEKKWCVINITEKRRMQMCRTEGRRNTEGNIKAGVKGEEDSEGKNRGTTKKQLNSALRQMTGRG